MNQQRRHSFSSSSSTPSPTRESDSPAVALGTHSYPIFRPTFQLLHPRITETLAETFNIVREVISHHAEKVERQIDILSTRELSVTHLKHLLAIATNYYQWASAASLLDHRYRHDQWKSDPQSDIYDFRLLQERLRCLRRTREEGDMTALCFLLRTSLSRNLGDMGNPRLYAKCYSGTKYLIEEYIQEVATCLKCVAESEMPDRHKLEFLMNTRQTFGRSALMLSGGAKLALFHIGVIKTLHSAKLLPRIISGASGGSIIAGFAGIHTDAEFDSLFSPTYAQINIFDETKTLQDMLTVILKGGTVFDAEALQDSCKSCFGELTFLEAYNRSRRILNVTVSSPTVYEMPRLLNYLTAPNVYLWSAIAASCAVPYVFKAATIMAKDRNGKPIPWNKAGHRFVDGSVLNDVPIKKIAELFNVNHFIVVQVNPHVTPFLTDPMPTGNSSSSNLGSFVHRLCFNALAFAKSELQLRASQLRELGILPNNLYFIESLVNQTYSGDITIVPRLAASDYLNLFTNPSPEDFLTWCLNGERATWPKLAIIRNHLELELALDNLLYFTRLRILSKLNGSSGTRPLSIKVDISLPAINTTDPNTSDGVRPDLMATDASTEQATAGPVTCPMSQVKPLSSSPPPSFSSSVPRADEVVSARLPQSVAELEKSLLCPLPSHPSMVFNKRRRL